ncbi:MAG: hypothetical protein HDT14_10450 [Oscillibacter sp.]|nr:hypothetical protein [Oscillibacter sp.]
MAKIKMKNSVTVAETFHDFLTGKKAAGVSEKTLLTYGQHFSAVSKHLSPDTPMDALINRFFVERERFLSNLSWPLNICYAA